MVTQIGQRIAEQARALEVESEEYWQAKEQKSFAEDVLLEEVLLIVKPALPALCSRVVSVGVVARGLALGVDTYVDEYGGIFTTWRDGWQQISVAKFLNSGGSVFSVIAVLLVALRAQLGTYAPKTAEVKRETEVLTTLADALVALKVK